MGVILDEMSYSKDFLKKRDSALGQTINTDVGEVFKSSVTQLSRCFYPYSHPHCVLILKVFLGAPVPVLALKNLYFFSELR